MEPDNKDTLKADKEYYRSLFDHLIESITWLKEHQGAELTIRREKIEKAYDYAYKAHKGQYRKGGLKLPYISHPVDVAIIAANTIGVRTNSVMAALLHDVVEDVEGVDVETVKLRFGDQVATIVEGLTKVSDLPPGEHNTKQSATYVKILKSAIDDFRTPLLKLADRLHNMRTMEDLSVGQKLVKASENFVIYIPLASKLGLYNVKREIEDLSFKHKYASEYETFLSQVNKTRINRYKRYKLFKLKLRNILNSHSTTKDSEIFLIQRSFYTVWQKTQKKNCSIDEVYNFTSFRIVFDETKDYLHKAYDIAVELKKYFKQHIVREKDYLTKPKSNGFGALILTIHDLGFYYEVQITNSEFHKIAQTGYSPIYGSLGMEGMRKQLERYNITPEILDIWRDQSTSTITVFTPKNDLIELPKGATVLDFAFRIHSELGLHCIGAEVDGKLKPIDYKLQGAESIKVFSSENITPKPEWKDFVISIRAIREIQAFLNKERKQNIDKGKTILIELLENMQQKPTPALNIYLRRIFFTDNIDNVYADVGSGQIKRERLVEIINSYIKNSDDYIDDKINETVDFNYKKPFIIDENTRFEIAKCCYPIPGDSAIVYYKKSQNKFIVHRKDCRNAEQLGAKHGKSTANVSWQCNASKLFMVELFIEGFDRSKLGFDLLKIFNHYTDVKIQALQLQVVDKEIFTGMITLLVPDKEFLEKIIAKIKKVNNIRQVYRKTNS